MDKFVLKPDKRTLSIPYGVQTMNIIFDELAWKRLLKEIRSLK